MENKQYTHFKSQLCNTLIGYSVMEKDKQGRDLGSAGGAMEGCGFKWESRKASPSAAKP